jgi:hypothetical protein
MAVGSLGILLGSCGGKILAKKPLSPIHLEAEERRKNTRRINLLPFNSNTLLAKSSTNSTFLA